MNELLPIGTIVHSQMEGRHDGEIVGHNTSQGLYNAERYPYIIRWCDGYQDVYGIDGGLIWT